MMGEVSKVDNEDFNKLKAFIEKLPRQERIRPILAIEGRLLNWEDILEEFKNDGKLKDKILEKIKERIK